MVDYRNLREDLHPILAIQLLIQIIVVRRDSKLQIVMQETHLCASLIFIYAKHESSFSLRYR